MARRRCFTLASGRRNDVKPLPSKLGNGVVDAESQELRGVSVVRLADRRRTSCLCLALACMSVEWPYRRQPVSTCLTETEALLEL